MFTFGLPFWGIAESREGSRVLGGSAGLALRVRVCQATVMGLMSTKKK
jgi:hypothetical protein